MIQNRRAYQLIHCRTHSRLLAGAGSPVPEARSRRDLPAAAAAGPGGDPFGHRAGI